MAGRELWLGGVRIEHELGLLGHSDADVLIHALCDALLGAANLRDIGYHFPNTAAEYKDIDSKVLLRETVRLLREHGYEPGNADCTICAEQCFVSSCHLILGDTKGILTMFVRKKKYPSGNIGVIVVEK